MKKFSELKVAKVGEVTIGGPIEMRPNPVGPGPRIPHSRLCQRRGAPVMRLSWDGRLEAWCPACGRHALIEDASVSPEVGRVEGAERP